MTGSGMTMGSSSFRLYSSAGSLIAARKWENPYMITGAKDAGIALLCLTASAATCTAQPADAKHGHALAARLCAQCHLVDGGSPNARLADVPSFSAIAARPGVSAEQLAGRIIIPHPEMPGVQLTTREIRDVVSYILSLK
jgi:cytochrome c